MYFADLQSSDRSRGWRCASRKMRASFILLLKKARLAEPAKAALRLVEGYHPRTIRHRKRMMSFYGQFIRQGDLCFDVGANVGNRTEVFLKLGARVVAIEPQADCIRGLQRQVGRNANVRLLQKGLGAKPGQKELFISDAHTISSVSKEWISAVRDSGRFAAYRWDRSQLITMTTLDLLIESYGVPAFCKIDVEGAELTVLKGLSKPIKALSFEFTPEFVASTLGCIEHLSGLGSVAYNYSVEESMCLTLSNWVTGEEMCEILKGLPDKTLFGDVYARFISYAPSP